MLKGSFTLTYEDHFSKMTEEERVGLIMGLHGLVERYDLTLGEGSYILTMQTVIAYDDRPETLLAYQRLDGFVIGYLSALGFDQDGVRHYQRREEILANITRMVQKELDTPAQEPYNTHTTKSLHTYDRVVDLLRTSGQVS